MPLIVRALIHWALNVLALLAADWAFDGFSIERWWPVLLAGAVLGLANVFLKPLVTFIALPLILLTFGIAYFFVNVVMLLFTEQYFRRCAKRVGLPAWRGPDTAAAIILRGMLAAASRRIAERELARVENAFLECARVS